MLMDLVKTRIRNTKKIVLVFAILIILLLLSFLVFSLNSDAKLKLYFLDIGMGDAAYIRTPYEQNIIIDGGPSQAVLAKIGKYIPFYDRKIDLIILTHPEADHLTGLVEIIRRYNIELILMPKIIRHTELFQVWKNELEQKNIPIIYAKAGDEFNLGTDLKIEILNPNENLSTETGLNDSSIVAKINFRKQKILFTGDISQRVEADLVSSYDLKADILKVAHHGSSTSSSSIFLKKIKPEICILSVGKNKFGLPSLRVIKRLNNFCQILRTDQEGDIKFAL